MTTNLLQVLCKVDGSLSCEKRLCYYEEPWLTSEEITELNPNDFVYDLDLKTYIRVGDTNAYEQAADKIRDVAEPLHNWLLSEDPKTL
jgi:hypothetical protein